MIPKRMCFFWARGPMSWLRYMTLKSFRVLNPTWETRLYIADVQPPIALQHVEKQDYRFYRGRDYTEGVAELGVQVLDWEPHRRDVSPANASDLFQWSILAEVGGWYSDMDILFTNPMESMDCYDAASKSDCVFCFSSDGVTIGFVGSFPGGQCFTDLAAVAKRNYTPLIYQSTGANALMRLAGVKPRDEGDPEPKTGDAVAAEVLDSLRKKYHGTRIHSLPSMTVYPFTERRFARLYQGRSDVPSFCVGIHWFAGNIDAQLLNLCMTGENVGSYENTIAMHAEKIEAIGGGK